MIQGHGGNVVGLAEQLGCRPEDIVDMSFLDVAQAKYK